MIPLLALPVVVFDFTVDDGGLVETGDTLQWAWGAPTKGPVGQGTCWATTLAGPYLHDSTDALTLDLPDLSALGHPVLELVHSYAIEPGDVGRVELDTGAGFAPLDPYGEYPVAGGFSGAQGAYGPAWFELPAIASARLRLVFASDPADAADGWFVQRLTVLDGDAVPPEVSALASPADTQDFVGPYPVEVRVEDETRVDGVTLFREVDGVPQAPVPMARAGGRVWSADLPGLPPGTRCDWWVEADDGENVTRWPATGAESFRAYLAAPTGLRADLPRRPVVQEVPLAWDPPESPHPVTGYELVEVASGTVVGTSAAPELVLPLTPDGERAFRVRATYDEGTGDLSEALDLQVEVPELTLDPARVWQGEHVFVAVTGRSLYLDPTAVFDPGEGVTVEEVTLLDAGRASILLTIAPDAPVGVRPFGLSTTWGDFVFDGLEVGDPRDAPRIATVTPAALRQGQELTVTLGATVPFVAPVTIEVDDTLVVVSDVAVDGSTASFRLVASGAATPGPHDLLVRDGRHLFPTQIGVLEQRLVYTRTCGCAALDVSPAPWTVLLLAAVRRRRPAPPATAR